MPSFLQFVTGLKTVVSQLLPRTVVLKINRFRRRKELLEAKRTFNQSTLSDGLLTIEDLRVLYSQGVFNANYGYSKADLDNRAKKKVSQLLKMGRGKTIQTYLELGCWDGMVCHYLQTLGKTAIGIDNRAVGFDSRALDAGVKLIAMDVAKLEFEDNSFDFCFSYDAFEHFPDPEQALKEIVRVTKPGGYIFLEFGPLFNSPWGMHGYSVLPVVYLPLLFSKETIVQFLAEEKLGKFNFNHCNGWSLTQFRELWDSYSTMLEKREYLEVHNYGHLDTINKYASVLKMKTLNFEELTCAEIGVLFRKKLK